MSTRTTVEVFCDNPNCKRVRVFGGENRGGVNVSTALERVRGDGWQTKGHEAFCPEHTLTQRCEYEGLVYWGAIGTSWGTRRRCSLRAGHKGQHRSKSFILVDDPVQGDEQPDDETIARVMRKVGRLDEDAPPTVTDRAYDMDQ